METTKYIKQSAKRVAIFSLLILPFFLIGIKVGYNKWAGDIKPIPWEDFLALLPKAMIIYTANVICFFIIYTMMLIFLKGSNDSYICTECENVLKKWQMDKNSGKCTVCGSNMEPLEGFYERHPDKRD
nr:hypothetical protein [uncultured Desulfuromonas sp.]